MGPDAGRAPCGAGTIRCHRSCRIESDRCRKSPPPGRDNRRPGGLSVPVMSRSDHPAHRELPLSPRATVRRTPQPGLHALSCRLRCAGRAAPADRAGRSCRGALLVAVEGTLDQRRPVRAHRPAPRRRAPVHRLRGHLLGCPIAGAREKMRKVELSTLWFREWRGQLGLDIIGQVFDGRAVGTEVIRACGTQHLI